MAGFKKLERSMTFDERPRNALPSFKPMKKAQSFACDSRAQKSSHDERVNFSDIIFRRYFGMDDRDMIAPSQLMLSKSLPTALFTSLPQTSAEARANEAVIVVDCFSTGAMLAFSIHKAGYRVISVMSADLGSLLDYMPDGVHFDFAAKLQYKSISDNEAAAIDTLIDEIAGVGLQIVAVIAGAETGVELADMLSEKMGLRTNGTALSEARRNKFVMGETIKSAGLRAVHQLRASTWAEISTWITSWNPDPFKVIVKPLDSAGSDDVTLCLSIEDVQAAFGNIMGKVNGLGLVNRAVLVQEYLEGQEYVVDMVSRDGEHKVAAIWAYDRRAVNGAQFVCFGQRLLTMDDEHCVELVEYQKKVVTALGIKNGPTHGEVKWCRGEPVLVEVGARCHGGDGLWLNICDEAMGFNQVQAACLAYLDEAAFSSLPNAVRKLF